MATNPMHQFQVYRLGPEIKIAGIDLSFTNASLFMLLSAFMICVVLFLGTKEKLKSSSRNTDNDGNISSMGSAFKLSTDLVAHVAVGTIIGFILDSWFDTKPWLIIIFFFLGSVAGILNVIKTARQMQEKE